MKRIMVLLVSITFLTLLSACGDSEPKEAEPVVFENVSGELTVYYVDNIQFYTDTVAQLRSRYEGLTVNAITFENEEALRTKTAVEFATGGGSDVFLYDYYTMADVYRLAENNSYIDLTPYVAADKSYNPENYYTAVSDLGIIGGKRYIMPLTFNVPTLFTSAEKLSENGIELENEPYFSTLLRTIADSSIALENNNNQVSYLPTDRSMMLLASGIETVDYQNKLVNFDSEEFKEIMDFQKTLYKERPKVSSISQASSQDLVKAVSSAVFSSSMDDFLFFTLYYDTVYSKGMNQEFQPYPIPTYNEQGKYHAIPKLYTAISANSKNVDAAYAFVRLMMDAPCYNTDLANSRGVNVGADISLNKGVVNSYFKILSEGDIQVITGQRRLESDRLSRDMKAELERVLDNIVGGEFANQNVTDMIFEEMTPFFNDSNTYEACLASLKNKVGIYLNE